MSPYYTCMHHLSLLLGNYCEVVGRCVVNSHACLFLNNRLWRRCQYRGHWTTDRGVLRAIETDQLSAVWGDCLLEHFGETEENTPSLYVWELPLLVSTFKHYSPPPTSKDQVHKLIFCSCPCTPTRTPLIKVMHFWHEILCFFCYNIISLFQVILSL